MYPLFISIITVAIAEIGDKTMLLSLLLAARFHKPWPIIAGIFFATVANHSIAGWAGSWIASLLSPQTLRWLIVASFVAVGVWALVPDKLDENDQHLPKSNYGTFIATSTAFFLVEIGDKTQIATVVLAASYPSLWQVVIGTTIGMLLANAPIVFLGAKLAKRLPLKAARIIASLIFLALAAWVAVASPINPL